VYLVAITKEQFYEGKDLVEEDILSFFRQHQNTAYSFDEIKSTFNLKIGDLYYLLSDLETGGHINSKLVNGELYFIMK
jgi:hypothetical protein